MSTVACDDQYIAIRTILRRINVKIWNTALLCGALAISAGAVALQPQPVQAQGTTFPDVPTNHWAYQAVADLANAGYVKGYPDGSFLGKRALTRYEFATVIDRIVATVSDLQSKVSAQGAPVTPNGTPVTQDDLNKIQVLVDTFQHELDAIQSNVTDLQTQLDALRQDVLDAKAYALKAQTSANKAQKTADNSYGAGPGRKFSISGYIQTRYVAANSGSHYVYPQGANGAAAVGIQSAYNGTYAEGGTRSDVEVRRARISITGSPTDNTSYRAQLDFSGAISAGATGASGTANPSNISANQQLTVREANGTYTFGDGTSKYPSITAGLFATPFGYILPGSQSTNLTPERPLAFSEAGTVGLFNSQDYDKGAKINYTRYNMTATYALIDGSGRNAEDVNNHGDSIVRLAYASPTKIFNVGASYYNGAVYRPRPTSGPSLNAQTYPEPKKQLFGIDGQANYKSFFADYEFVRGTYESRSYFDEYATNAYSSVNGNPLGYMNDSYIKGNQVQGSYVWGGYTFFAATPRPLTLAVDYDVFQRSMTAQNNVLNTYGTGTYHGGNSSYDDVNLGYGALYNLDKATRLRLWYDEPFAIAHMPGTPEPPKYGLYTVEMQVKF
jgi:hypothetical protein